jgi:hypothetical protein
VPLIQLPFAAGSYQSRSKSIDLQETINLYPEIQNPTSKSITSFIGTPGLKLLVDTAQTTQPRGIYVTGGGRVFYVNSNVLYEITYSPEFDTASSIERGAINTPDGYVSFCDSSLQMLIVDGLFGYCYDLQTDLLSVVPPPPPDSIYTYFPATPTSCCYFAGYFTVVNGGTNQFYISEAANCNLWPVYHIVVKGSSSVDSDPIEKIVSTPTYLWIFGTRSSELWYPTGQDDIALGLLPFARASEAGIDTGAIQGHTVQVNGSMVFWVGSNPSGANIVWKASSFLPERISTHSIEYLIGQIENKDDATSFCYQQEGHFFYVLNFPQGQKTYVYDMSSEQWHERGYWNMFIGKMENHLALFGCGAFNKSLVCDRRNGKIYEYDLDTYTDNGDYIRRVRTLPHTAKSQNWLYVFKVELDTQKGVGLNELTNGQPDPIDTDPLMSLQWSKDGGFSWSKEHWQGMGKIGQYKKRIIWPFGLGKARDWVFRFSTIAKVKVVLIAAFANIEEEMM